MCIHKFGRYAAHALYIRPPYAIESRWPPRVRGMYAGHTPLAPWIRNGQVLIRDIIRSGIAIHTPYAPHVRHPCVIDTQLIRNTCEIVAPEMFHQTISAILLRICYFFRTPYERRGIAGQWNRGFRNKIIHSLPWITIPLVTRVAISQPFPLRWIMSHVPYLPINMEIT